jgi:predicted RNA methylase
MVKEWTYGDSWEKFPINENEVWKAGNHLLTVRDLTNLTNLDFFGIKEFDMSYIDPPWNTGNINSFYTKAGLEERKQFNSFIIKLIDLIKVCSPEVNYMEMGKQNKDFVINEIENAGGKVTNEWKITYYKKFPCFLIRYTFSDLPGIDLNLTGIDDDDTPMIVMQAEKNISNVIDLCTGRGLTGRTAQKLGISFYGNELNKRRLACLIDYYSQLNLPISKINI